MRCSAAAAAVGRAGFDRQAARRDPDRGRPVVAAQHSPNIMLIPGTSSVNHLRQNIAGAALALPSDAVAN